MAERIFLGFDGDPRWDGEARITSVTDEYGRPIHSEVFRAITDGGALGAKFTLEINKGSFDE